MSSKRLLLACLAAFVLCLADGAAARKPARDSGGQPTDVAGTYDYYVMALSWSPTFCQTRGQDEEDQCGEKGYGFILHGLWPQYEKGGGPERCETRDSGPDRGTVAQTLAFMPSRRLINHEWRKHGACTGLGADKYFQTADRAFAALHVPPELKAPHQDLQMNGDELRAALKRANPELRDDMMSLHCSKGQLVEVRVCLDKDTRLRSCGKRMRNACPASRPFEIPAVR
jgi:ribonuclease T2